MFCLFWFFFFFSSRRRHTRWPRDWSSDVCSSDLFGRPTDLDNDGHVFILYTPRVNALTKRGSTSFFGGFFFGGDLFPRTGTGGCAESRSEERRVGKECR